MKTFLLAAFAFLLLSSCSDSGQEEMIPQNKFEVNFNLSTFNVYYEGTKSTKPLDEKIDALYYKIWQTNEEKTDATAFYISSEEITNSNLNLQLEKGHYDIQFVGVKYDTDKPNGFIDFPDEFDGEENYIKCFSYGNFYFGKTSFDVTESNINQSVKLELINAKISINLTSNNFLSEINCVKYELEGGCFDYYPNLDHHNIARYTSYNYDLLSEDSYPTYTYSRSYPVILPKMDEGKEYLITLRIGSFHADPDNTDNKTKIFDPITAEVKVKKGRNTIVNCNANWSDSNITIDIEDVNFEEITVEI